MDKERYIPAETCCLQFRWINAQCIQMKLPNGKVILTDPFFPSPTTPWNVSKEMFDAYALEDPFDESSLEKVDYIIINHTHGDHILKLEEVYQKYHPIVIIHSPMAYDLALTHEINLSDIYPVDFGGTYYFDGFQIRTFHGTHHPVRNTYSQMPAADACDNPRAGKMSVLGGLFNMNFIVTTDEHVNIGFIGGDIDGDFEMFRACCPDILFRNKLHSSKAEYDVVKEWADYLIQSHAKLMVPMHHEKWLTGKAGYTTKLVEEMNEYLKEHHAVARVLNPKRTQWYSLKVGLEAVE